MASSPEPLTTVDKPITSLNNDAFAAICFSLTVSQGMRGRSWDGVAGKIGFSMGQIQAMRQHQEQDKGRLLLATWERLNKTGATVKNLIFALASLSMRECINALQEDPSILDGDIELAQNECEQLMKTGKFSSHFPGYSNVQFSEALYNHQHMQRDPGPPFPPVAVPVNNHQCVTEEMSQSANDAQSDSAVESGVETNTVFISYYPLCGDAGQKQSKQLEDLTNYLRQYGYTVYYDKFFKVQIQQYGGVNLWKEAHISKSETILVICTPEFYQDDEKALMERERSKIEVDRKMLRSIAYSNKCDRLIPVLLDEYKNVRNCIPTFLQPFALHFWPSKKQDLMYCIGRVAKYQLPEIPAHEKKVLKPIVIQVPRRKELPKPVQIQPAEGKELKSKNIHPHEKKVLKPTVIQAPRRKEVAQTHEMKPNVVQMSRQKELSMVQPQPHAKKGHFRTFSRLKKVLKLK